MHRASCLQKKIVAPPLIPKRDFSRSVTILSSSFHINC
jgi:hypothetical protein